MTHYGNDPPLSALLVIAPTGGYTGRVKRGLDTVLASETKVAAPETKVQVVLVIGQEWLQMDQKYREKFVQPVKEHVLATWKETVGLDLVCEEIELPMENEEYLTGWLLARLYDFYESFQDQEKQQGQVEEGEPEEEEVEDEEEVEVAGEAEAYIDLTSAPKEWQFAAINVSNFFPNLELYYIKRKNRPTPEEYVGQDKDEGLPKLETVRAGVARPPLPRWIMPKDLKGTPNLHYVLFQTIFEMAETIATQKKTDTGEQVALDRISVPILEIRKGLLEYRKRFPDDLDKKTKTKFESDSALQRHISRLLTDVAPYRLFERTGTRSIRMTSRAVMLGQALFLKKKR
ncbi:MAG: hypothetical protein ABSG74_13970 [Candidatus Bathyarchaeia archaeon]